MKPDGVPDFRDERFVYFGDQANMPYGRYAAAGKADFLRELAVRDAQFVLGSQGHDPSKAVVIACNTATAYGLERVSAMARPGDAAVTGVVNAGVDGVLDAMRGETRPYAARPFQSRSRHAAESALRRPSRTASREWGNALARTSSRWWKTTAHAEARRP